MMKLRWSLPLMLCLTPLAAPAADSMKPTMPKPFTATYKVLRKGSVLGTATMSLTKQTNGTWSYHSRVTATSGLAAMLHASIDERSDFRWHDGHMEALRYDYRLHTAVKSRERHVHVDWKAHSVLVRTSKGKRFSYTTVPGLVERHLLVLVLGQAIAADRGHVKLAVAVKDRVATQTYAMRGKEHITVPMGSFTATRVVRTDKQNHYAAWYDPARFGDAPVKLAQKSGGHITMLLKSWHRGPPAGS